MSQITPASRRANRLWEKRVAKNAIASPFCNCNAAQELVKSQVINIYAQKSAGRACKRSDSVVFTQSVVSLAFLLVSNKI